MKIKNIFKKIYKVSKLFPPIAQIENLQNPKQDEMLQKILFVLEDIKTILENKK